MNKKLLTILLLTIIIATFGLYFLEKAYATSRKHDVVIKLKEEESYINPENLEFFIKIIDEKEIEKHRLYLEDLNIENNKVRYIFKNKVSKSQSVILISLPGHCHKPVGVRGITFCVSVSESLNKTAMKNALILKDIIAHSIVKNVKNKSNLLYHEQKPLKTLPPSKTSQLSQKVNSFKKLQLSDIQFGIIFFLFLFLILSGIISIISSISKFKVIPAHIFMLFIIVAAFTLRMFATQFTSDIRDPVDMGYVISTQTHRWAAGYSVFLHILFRLFNPAHETVFMANIVIGTLTVLILYIFVAIYFKDEVLAFASATVLAFLPIHAKFSASDSAHILLTFSYLASLCFLSLWAYKGTFWHLIQGMGWLVFSFNVRQESLVYSMSALFIVVGCLQNYSLRKMIQWVLAGVLSSAFAIQPLLNILSEIKNPSVGGIFIRSGYKSNPFFLGRDASVPLAISALVPLIMLLIYILLTLRRNNNIDFKKYSERFRLGIYLFAATFIIALPGWFDPLDDRIGNTNYRYFIPLLATYSIFSGYGLKSLTSLFWRFKWVHLSAIALTALLFSAPYWDLLKRTWTHQLEFEFIRKNIKLVSSGCTIVRRAPFIAESGLEPSPYISVEAGLKHIWINTSDFLSKGKIDRCVVYYQSASCFSKKPGITRKDTIEISERIINECKEMRNKYELIPIAEAKLPALPYVGEKYLVKPVPVGFYLLKLKK